MEKSLSLISRILEGARLTLKACASPHREDIFLFVEIQISLFINTLNSQMQHLEMVLALFGHQLTLLRIFSQLRVKAKIKLKSTRTCKNSMLSIQASPSNRFSVEFSSVSGAKSSLPSTIGRPKFSSEGSTCHQPLKMFTGVKTAKMWS